MRSIGLVGPKHSGKTTASAYLVKHHDYYRLALADPVKNAAVLAVNAINEYIDLPPIDRDYLDRHKDEVFVPFLQWLGTEYGREFTENPTRWIDMFLWQAGVQRVPVVCDDIRFENEAEALRNAGFLIIRVFRTKDERMKSMLDAGVDPAKIRAVMEHKSETELEKIEADFIINAPNVPAQHAALDWCLNFHEVALALHKAHGHPESVYTASPDVLSGCAKLLDDLRDLEALVVVSHPATLARMELIRTCAAD